MLEQTRSSLGFTNHAALEFNNSVAPIVSKICEPLFSNFGLTVFGYSHFLANGRYLDICTHTQWQKHYLEEFASKTFIKDYIGKIRQTDTKYILWDNRPDIPREKNFSQFIIDSCSYDIWHGFSIYKKHDNSLEAWHFATTKENYEVINFYLNRLDLLYHFILYFKDQAGKIIDTNDPKKLIRIEDRCPQNLELQGGEITKRPQDFISQTVIKRFSLTTERGIVFISKREAECMRHLGASKTVKEIAKVMSLSPRTVESYLTNIKNKLNCSSKSEIINLFEQNYIKYL